MSPIFVPTIKITLFLRIKLVHRLFFSLIPKFQHRWERSKKYPSRYVTEQNLPIRPQDPNKKFENLDFKHIGHLLSIVS